MFVLMYCFHLFFLLIPNLWVNTFGEVILNNGVEWVRLQQRKYFTNLLQKDGVSPNMTLVLRCSHVKMFLEVLYFDKLFFCSMFF